MAERQDTDADINRLYWESDLPVAEIAERLGVSRRALYDGIRPRPAGIPCPSCGGELGFRNRRAAESREAECAACGTGQVVPGSADGRGSAGRSKGSAEATPRRRPPQPDHAPERGSGPVLGAAMVAGLAVGAALGWAVRRG